MASSILATAAMPGSTTTPESPIAEEDPQIFVSLTHDPLSITALVDRVRSPKAGAIVLFAGEPVHTLRRVPWGALRFFRDAILFRLFVSPIHALTQPALN